MRSAPLPVTGPLGCASIEYKDADRIRIDYRQSCMLSRFLRARADADGPLGENSGKARRGRISTIFGLLRTAAMDISARINGFLPCRYPEVQTSAVSPTAA